MNLLIVILLLNLASLQESFVFPAYNAHHMISRSPLRVVLKDETDSTKSISTSTQQQSSKRILETSSLMFLLSGPLGMMLDNYHGLFGVLEYNDIGLPIKVVMGSKVLLKTASWVPILFGIAGSLMSFIILNLDNLIGTRMEIKNPTWPKVLYGISMFSAQYYISGLLDYTMINSTLINAILAIAAIVGYIFFDGSTAGFLLACATAIGGPLAEIFLINIPHLYQYSHADFMGICTWIPWVYFLGMYVCI
jgi:hypothetical protein